MSNEFKKYAVVLTSTVNSKPDFQVSIQFLVNSDMTAKQLRSFYLCKGSVSVSDVYVETLEELAQENYQYP
jgi:hypothetical protein